VNSNILEEIQMNSISRFFSSVSLKVKQDRNWYFVIDSKVAFDFLSKRVCST